MAPLETAYERHIFDRRACLWLLTRPDDIRPGPGRVEFLHIIIIIITECSILNNGAVIVINCAWPNATCLHLQTGLENEN